MVIAVALTYSMQIAEIGSLAIYRLCLARGAHVQKTPCELLLLNVICCCAEGLIPS